MTTRQDKSFESRFPAAGFVLDIVLFIVSLILNWPAFWVVWPLGSVAWIGVLYLAFTQVDSLRKLPNDVKLARSIVFSIVALIVVWVPMRGYHEREQARSTEGDLAPKTIEPMSARARFPLLDAGEGTAPLEGTGPTGQLLYDAGIALQWGEKGPDFSTTIRDKSGNEIVEVRKNHWRVTTFCLDKNYTADTLEVQDSRGHVVLQLTILPDRVRLQGQWYNDTGRGLEIFKSPDPARPGTLIYPTDRNSGHDTTEYLIPPIFEYPSRNHWGVFRK